MSRRKRRHLVPQKTVCLLAGIQRQAHPIVSIARNRTFPLNMRSYKRRLGASSADTPNPGSKTFSSPLERPQKVQDMLLVDLVLRVKVLNDPVGLGRTKMSVARAGMGCGRFPEVAGATVVQEENSLAQPPHLL